MERLGSNPCYEDSYDVFLGLQYFVLFCHSVIRSMRLGIILCDCYHWLCCGKVWWIKVLLCLSFLRVILKCGLVLNILWEIRQILTTITVGGMWSTSWYDVTPVPITKRRKREKNVVWNAEFSKVKVPRVFSTMDFSCIFPQLCDSEYSACEMII